MAPVARPGSVLKGIRLQKGWTLADVSRLTGLPVSTVSKIENDKMSLTYDKLARISKGLGIDIGLLFAADDARPALTSSTGRRSVARVGEGKVIETAAYGHLYPATELLNKRFIPIVAEIHARSLTDFGEMIRHSGEEYTYVLEGVVELHTDLYAPARLEAGDSIYFDSGMSHAYIAVGPTRCRVLAICSGDESQLIAAVEKGLAAAKPTSEIQVDMSLAPTRGSTRRVGAARSHRAR